MCPGDLLRRSAQASVGVPTDIKDGASGVTYDMKQGGQNGKSNRH